MTGVDIFLGRPVEDDDDDDDDNGNRSEGVQEFERKRWNLNARFRDDRSEDRLRPETFDLINSRLLAEGINAERWPSYIRELKQMLKPGGWLQLVEPQLHFQSSTGRLSDDSNLSRWWQWYARTQERMGKNPRIGRTLPQLLSADGFENIRHLSLDLPIGDWMPGRSSSMCRSLTFASYRSLMQVPGRASLGRDSLENVDQMLTSLSLWPFLRIGGMAEDSYRSLISGARRELRDPSYRLYYKV